MLKQIQVIPSPFSSGRYTAFCTMRIQAPAHTVRFLTHINHHHHHHSNPLYFWSSTEPVRSPSEPFPRSTLDTEHSPEEASMCYASQRDKAREENRRRERAGEIEREIWGAGARAREGRRRVGDSER